MPRRISVELVGDSRSLERAFARSSRAATNFARTTQTTSASIKRSTSTAGTGLAAIPVATAGTAARAERSLKSTESELAALSAATAATAATSERSLTRVAGKLTTFTANWDTLAKAMLRNDPAQIATALKTVDTQIDTTSRKTAGLAAAFAKLGVLRATAIGGGVVATIEAISRAVHAAADSERILGQTRVALESTGRSWDQYGERIQAAVEIQSKFGFDDEALLQSFSVFIRGSDSVTQALERNELAMDVARGRFIDLESATLIVTKAAQGQSGALRRLGINVNKNATATQLLEALQRKYGKAAESASDEGATSMERFSVSVENLQESLGNLLLPAVANLADALAGAADNANRLIGVLGKIGSIHIPEINIPLKIGGQELGGIGGDVGANLATGFGQAFKNALAQVAPGSTLVGPLVDAFNRIPGVASDAGAKAGASFGERLAEHVRASFENLRAAFESLAPRSTAEQRNTWFDAALGRREDRVQDIQTTQGQLAELERIAIAIKKRLADTSDRTRILHLEDELLQVTRRQAEVQDDLARKVAARARQERENRAAAVQRRNTVFDTKIGRELERVQDIQGKNETDALRRQLARLRQIAQELLARRAVTKDATRRLNLEDAYLRVLREQRSVQSDITTSIKAANDALKERAAAIKSAVLQRLQQRQTDVLNKRALADAKEQLRIAKQLGGPKGIRAAQRGIQDVQFQMLQARVEKAKPTLTRGGQFALGGVITINVNGVTDPDEVARRVAAVLTKRKKHTATQSRGPAAANA